MAETTTKPIILVVDDDAIIRVVIRKILETEYQVVEAADGEAGLQKAREIKPVAVIADVQMPKMNGFALCKAICDDFELSDIPVMMISAEENADELLKVYDVGGQGFITKPINHKALLTRIAHMLQQSAERAQMKSQISYATNTAFTAMSSMSETGLLMETLKNFNGSNTAQGLAQLLIAALQQFQLDGVVQLKTDAGIVALNLKGEASGVELAVLQKMATMERIVRFRNRLSVNYPNVQLIVNNMPVDDEERSGRLRDHLAILIEAAESRLEAIKVKTTLIATQNQLAIMSSIQSLTTTLSEIDQQQRQGNVERAALFGDVMMNMESALSAFGLSDRQEESLLSVVRNGWEKITAIYTDEAALQNKLSQVVQTLKNSLEEI
ncbi:MULTISPECIES: response regulator [Deefgea]|uniref:Response regulator n=1 Tax=Deefgea chitinilytica TaxID=570276 RepID=A0ABS2CG53_9NEIS|nr:MULTISPECIES: response regulator [Deefgea]MBM5572408.1 response regulator [Deefgea chitinilytica]MBM9889644.1 response regulator [Deefgea sp. CFH1-16]